MTPVVSFLYLYKHFPNQIDCGEVLEDEKRDAELEVPCADFVAEDEHTCVYSNTAKQRRQEEQEPFRSAVSVATAPLPSNSLPFVIAHNKERKNIDGHKNANKNLL